jgi:hypothetical protein
MLKSSSLCLYSSNLGTFWLKIEEFWPFEEISIFSNGGHLGYKTVLTVSFYVSTATFFLLHCDEWDRVVALPRHKFVTGATLLQLILTDYAN